MRQRLNSEATKVARAFAKRQANSGRLSWSTGDVVYLRANPIVHRFFTGAGNDKKAYISFHMHGWPTQLTISRWNAIALELFGEPVFTLKRGKVFFGPGLLREVDSNETLVLPEDFKPDRSLCAPKTDLQEEAAP